MSGTARKVLVFVDTDIVVRAFLASDTFRALESRHHVQYVVPDDRGKAKKALNVDVRDYGVSNPRYCGIQRKRSGYWYFLFAATALNRHRGSETYYIVRDAKLRRELGRRNVRIVEFLSLPGIYNAFRWVLKHLMGRAAELEQVLDEERPDLIIYPTVLTGIFLNDLVRSAERRKVPIILCMNSWDNPTSKAVCTGMPTWLVVWGEQSKRESERFLGIPGDRIVAFGAAQFQVYRQPPSESRSELARRFDVPLDKKIILYAGVGESFHETELLQKLEAAVASGLLDNCHILYRPHPWRGRLLEGEQDFFSLTWHHVTMDPHMVEYYQREIGEASRELFMIDYQITNQVLTLADAVISPRSTLLLEALVKGKPVLVLFPEGVQEHTQFNVRSVHFRDFCALDVVNTWFGHGQLSERLADLRVQMNDPGIADQLRAAAEHFCVTSDPPYGDRLAGLADSTLGLPANVPTEPDAATTERRVERASGWV